jgi:hypothetical protein
MWIMNSYVNIELDKATEKYNAINEYISKEITNEFRKIEDKNTETYKCISEKIANELYKGNKKN